MSLINPNTAHIWGPATGCRAYPHVALGYPSEDTEDKKRGRAAHYLGAEMIKAHTEGGEFPLLSDSLTDNMGYPIDRDIYDAAQIYATDVVETWRVYRKMHPVALEHTLTFPSVHPDQKGKPDAWMWVPGNAPSGTWNELYIWEYKNGHRAISPVDHYPMINYVSGILDLLEVDGHGDQRTTVIFRVVQPHCYTTGGGPISEHVVTASDLRGPINTLRKAAEEVYSGVAPRHAGPHCIDCPACFECSECINSIAGLCDVTGVTGDTIRQSENIDSLCTLFNVVDDLSTRLSGVHKALKAEIIQRLQKGERSTLKTLKTTLSRVQWACSPTEIIQLGENLGFNLRKDELITPKQAIEMGMDPETVNAFSSQKQTGFKLDDISSQKARSLFYGNR